MSTDFVTSGEGTVCTVMIMKIILHCVQHLQYVFKITVSPTYVHTSRYVYETILK